MQLLKVSLDLGLVIPLTSYHRANLSFPPGRVESVQLVLKTDFHRVKQLHVSQQKHCPDPNHYGQSLSLLCSMC